MKKYLRDRILLTGGGTSGSVTPLLAVVDELGKKDFEFLWIGTKKGPERIMVEKEGIRFKKILAIKLHRYVSIYTLIYTLFSPIFFIFGFIQSFFIILKFRPQWILTTGSFVSVPVVWVGWFLRRKILVHQQDVQTGLANKLMAPCARIVTVTFEKSLEDYGKKAKWIGNPARITNYELRITSFVFPCGYIVDPPYQNQRCDY